MTIAKNKINQDIDWVLTEYHRSFVIYPDVEKIFEGLDWILRRSKFGKFAPSMLITGGTGAGKTALIENYKDTHLSDSNILITRVRPSFTETLIWAIDMLHLPFNHRSKRSEIGLQDYFISCVQRSDLKLLVIEEAQELFECASPRERQKIRDRLKMISDACLLPIVFVGIPTARLILEDSQWNRRIMVKRELPYIRVTDDDSLDSYIDLLDGLRHFLPITAVPELSDMELAMKLLAASKGMVGQIKELVGYALELALLTGCKTLTMKHFSQAYATIQGADVPNPFSTKIDELLIPQIIEYEDYVLDSNSGEIKFTKQLFQDISVTDLLR